MEETFQERGRIRSKGVEALRSLRRAVDQAGGAEEVAKSIGSTRSHVSNVILAIRPLGKETAARLRPVLKVPDCVLLDALALERGDLPEVRQALSAEAAP